jgi:4-hydroxy-tetrahydrodipicolinate synthase
MPYNSRYLQLSWDEISLLNTSVIKHVKQNSRAKVIVSAPVECSTINSLKFAEEAFQAGADCFASAFGEKYFTENQVLSHYGALGDLGKPLLVHEQPLISGHNSKQMHWPITLVEKVASLSAVIGFKEDTKSHEFGQMILERDFPAQMIFAGRKSLFAPLLKHGLSSYLNGISIVNPKLAYVFWELAKSGDQEAVNRFVELVDDPFWDGPVKKYGWHRVNKASLEYFGLMPRWDRMPLPHLDADELKDLASFWDIHREVLSDWV